MKNEIKKINTKHCIIVAVVIIVIILLFSLLNGEKKYKNISIMINNEYIDLMNSPLVEDNSIYFSLDDVRKLFDNNIYYNEATKELITTYNTHIALLKNDENKVEINDEETIIIGNIKTENKIIYVPITDLATVYDIEIKYSNNSKRIIIDSLLKEKTEVTVKQRQKLKSGKNFFSRKIETLIIGDKLVVLDENDKYLKVRSPLGNIGYVKNKKVSEQIKIRENVEEEKLAVTPYFDYSNSSGIYNDISVNENERNVVLPEFFFIEKNDKLLDKTNIKTATYSVYKNWVDKNKLEILPTLKNNENVSKSLLNYSQRKNIINSLKQKILDYNYFGVNINFETIDDPNSFYRFIIELVPRFKESNLKVIVTISNNNIDRTKIENIVDYIIEE